MKQLLLTVVLVAGLTVNATVIEFHLSPSGTDTAEGLSPLNVVPQAAGSVAGGAELPGSLYFDTDNSTLTIGLGYGEMFGYGNLSTPLTGAGIYGPARVGQDGGLLFDLTSYNVPMGFPPAGGRLVGTVAYPAAEVPGLLQGLHFISLSSAVFPNGELRAQLIPVVQANSAPTLLCPGQVTVECGEPVSVTVRVDEPNGDPLMVVWVWNGWVVQTNQVPADSLPALVSLNVELPSDDGVLTVRATDPDGAEAVCSTAISVVDTTPPVVQSVVPDRDVLWPPNHKMVPVTLDAVVTDACGDTVWGIVSVTSNEASEGRGDGHFGGDWEILDDHTVLLRAERSGRGPGRIYTLGVQAADSAGNLSAVYSLKVVVPR